MGYSFVKWDSMRRWPCKEAGQWGPFERLVLGSHTGRSLTGILNGSKSNRLLVLNFRGKSISYPQG